MGAETRARTRAYRPLNYVALEPEGGDASTPDRVVRITRLANHELPLTVTRSVFRSRIFLNEDSVSRDVVQCVVNGIHRYRAPRSVPVVRVSRHDPTTVGRVSSASRFRQRSMTLTFSRGQMYGISPGTECSSVPVACARERIRGPETRAPKLLLLGVPASRRRPTPPCFQVASARACAASRARPALWSERPRCKSDSALEFISKPSSGGV